MLTPAVRSLGEIALQSSDIDTLLPPPLPTFRYASGQASNHDLLGTTAGASGHLRNNGGGGDGAGDGAAFMHAPHSGRVFPTHSLPSASAYTMPSSALPSPGFLASSIESNTNNNYNSSSNSSIRLPPMAGSTMGFSPSPSINNNNGGSSNSSATVVSAASNNLLGLVSPVLNYDTFPTSDMRMTSSPSAGVSGPIRRLQGTGSGVFSGGLGLAPLLSNNNNNNGNSNGGGSTSSPDSTSHFLPQSSETFISPIALDRPISLTRVSLSSLPLTPLTPKTPTSSMRSIGSSEQVVIANSASGPIIVRHVISSKSNNNGGSFNSSPPTLLTARSETSVLTGEASDANIAAVAAATSSETILQVPEIVEDLDSLEVGGVLEVATTATTVNDAPMENVVVNMDTVVGIVTTTDTKDTSTVEFGGGGTVVEDTTTAAFEEGKRDDSVIAVVASAISEGKEEDASWPVVPTTNIQSLEEEKWGGGMKLEEEK